MTQKPPAMPLARARLIVVKLGSAVLTTPTGELDLAVISETAATVAGVMRAGRRVILVSSGAVAAGRGALGMLGKPATIAEKQAFAAVGQSRLMSIYSDAFGQHGVIVGQMLLSRGDMEDRRRYVNARYTLEELLRRQCVPIINENDTVTVDELKFGDNDGLAALVAVKMQADALVLLSDVDGLYDSNPKTNPDARLVEVVERVTPAMLEQVSGAVSGGVAIGSGGMKSKLLAAQLATHEGVCVAIANGKRPGKLKNILSGTFRGTFFPAHPRRHSSREQWILNSRSAASRRIVVDDGARTALLERKKSLLPAGIARVEGQFRAGDVVEIVDSAGRVLGRGVVNYSAAELDRIKGRRSADIARVLGSKPYDEAIHRDNIAIVYRGA